VVEKLKTMGCIDHQFHTLCSVFMYAEKNCSDMVDSWVVVGDDDNSNDSCSEASNSLASDYDFRSDKEYIPELVDPRKTNACSQSVVPDVILQEIGVAMVCWITIWTTAMQCLD